MSKYLCDTCSREFPGGVTGSSFLVKPNGHTSHFCSGACLRAQVNGQAIDFPTSLKVLFYLGGVVTASVIAGILHFTR